MKRFEGKGVLVTGGGSGIGQATAQRLAQEGAQVLIVGRTGEKLEQAADKIKVETGVEIKTMSADVSSMEDCEAMVQEVVNAFGKIDCAFLNAGVRVFGALGMKTYRLADLILESGTCLSNCRQPG